MEPADSGSIILRGMQFPQQQRVRGQRGEPAAPLGIAILPPLPNAAGRGVGARCRLDHGGAMVAKAGGGAGAAWGAGAAGLVLPGRRQRLSVALSAKMSLIVCRSSKLSLTLGQPAARALAGPEAPGDPRPSARGPSHLCQRPACTALGESLQPLPPSEATGTPVCPSW